MNSKPLVFVARRIPTVGLRLLEEVSEVRLHSGDLPPTRQELLDGVQGCHGILSLLSDRIDGQAMDAAGPQLKVISNFAVGVDNIDLAEARRRGISVGNTPDVLTDATADVAVGLALAAARQFKLGMNAAASGQWKTWEPLGWLGYELKGKTVGIVGMGRIGQAVARRLHGGWQMQVLYTSRSAKPLLVEGMGARHVSLEELLEESDVISLHVPMTEETKNLISHAQFARMKPGAILVNTARGEVIDQSALVAALQQKRLFAAGLDVCTPEPLPLDHPLHRLENCLLLPHLGSATVEARNAMAERAARNIMEGLAGRKIPFTP